MPVTDSTHAPPSEAAADRAPTAGRASRKRRTGGACRSMLAALAALAFVSGAACKRAPSGEPAQAPASAKLQALRIPPAAGKTEYLMVLLHGVGATAASFAPIAQTLAPKLPTTEFLVPGGTDPFDGGPPGRQWFSLHGVTDENRAARIEAAGPPLLAWIDRELTARGLGRDRLIVLGFSQGAMMADWLAVRANPPPAAVVALSGRLAVPRRPGDSTDAVVLIVHGADDTVVPVRFAEEAAAELRERGLDVELHILPGLAHRVDRRVLAAVESFLAGVTAGKNATQ